MSASPSTPEPSPLARFVRAGSARRAVAVALASVALGAAMPHPRASAGDARAEALAAALAAADPEARRAALLALDAPTEACVPALVRALADPDPAVRLAALAAADALAEPLRGGALAEALLSSDPGLVRAAAHALAARPSPLAARALAEALAAPDPGDEVYLALVRAAVEARAPDLAPSLIAALAAVDARARLAAIEGLALHEEPPSGARAAFEDGVYDELEPVRVAALGALAAYGDDAAVDDLAEVAGDASEPLPVRAAALDALGRAALRARERLRVEQDEDAETIEGWIAAGHGPPWLRGDAAAWLVAIDRAARALGDGLALPDPARESALAAIERLGAASERTVHALARALPALPLPQARRAVALLGAIGPRAEPAAAVVAAALDAQDDELAVMAASALARMGGDGARALGRVAADPRRPSAVRALALQSLRAAPPDRIRAALAGQPAEPAPDADPVLTRALADALVAAGEDEPAAAHFAALAGAESPPVRLAALDALRRLPPRAAARALPALERALSDSDPEARRLALACLEALGPVARPAAPALAALLAAPAASERAAAAEILAHLAALEPSLDEPVARALGALLRADVDPRARLAAARAALAPADATEAAMTEAVAALLAEPPAAAGAARTALLAALGARAEVGRALPPLDARALEALIAAALDAPPGQDPRVPEMRTLLEVLGERAEPAIAPLAAVIARDLAADLAPPASEASRAFVAADLLAAIGTDAARAALREAGLAAAESASSVAAPRAPLEAAARRALAIDCLALCVAGRRDADPEGHAALAALLIEQALPPVVREPDDDDDDDGLDDDLRALIVRAGVPAEGSLLTEAIALHLGAEEPLRREVAAGLLAAEERAHRAGLGALAAALAREAEPSVRRAASEAVAALGAEAASAGPLLAPGLLATLARGEGLPDGAHVHLPVILEAAFARGEADVTAAACDAIEGIAGLAAAPLADRVVAFAVDGPPGPDRRAAWRAVALLGGLAAPHERRVARAVLAEGAGVEEVYALARLRPTGAEALAIFESACWAEERASLGGDAGGEGAGGAGTEVDHGGDGDDGGDDEDGDDDRDEARPAGEDGPARFGVGGGRARSLLEGLGVEDASDGARGADGARGDTGARLVRLGLLPELPRYEAGSVPGEVLEALFAAGPPARPHLRRLLREGRSELRERVLAQAGAAHDPDGLLVPAIATCLSDPAPAVRHAALRALAERGEHARAAEPQVVALLDDADPSVALAATGALGALGARGARERVAEQLAIARARLAADPADEAGALLAPAAALALLELGAEDDALLDALVRAPSCDGFLWAVERRLGGGDLRPALSRWLRDPDREVAARAAVGLTLLGAAALPALAGALEAPAAHTREVAAFALEVVLDHHPARQTARPTPEWAGSESQADGSSMLTCTAWTGPRARELEGWEGALAALAAALAREREEAVLAPICEALGTFGDAARASSPRAVEVLFASADEEVRWRAAFLVSQAGCADPGAASALAALLGEDRGWLGEQGWAVTWARAGGAVTIRALEERLASLAPDRRAVTLRSIAVDGPLAPDLVPLLAGCLGDGDAGVVRAALLALDAVEGPVPPDLAAPAIERLRRLAAPGAPASTRGPALAALARLAPGAAAPLCADALGGRSPALVEAAARGLGAAIGSGALDPAEAAAGVEALARLVDEVLAGRFALAHGGRIGRAAADGLARAGAAALASEAISERLVRLVGEPGGAGVREAAIEALGAVGATSTLAVVTGQVAAGPASCRLAAVRALERCTPRLPAGAARASAVEALGEALFDLDDEVDLAAVEALERLGPESAPAVGALARAVHAWASGAGRSDRAEPGVRALGAIGPAAAGALPLLERLSTAHAHDGIRAAAAAAVAKIRR